VFPNDQRATMIANCWDLEANRRIPKPELAATSDYLSDAWEIKLSAMWYGEQSDEEAITNFFRHIRELPEDVLKHILCRHQWRLDDETCDLGCCHRK
jgi:hypothetical protein